MNLVTCIVMKLNNLEVVLIESLKYSGPSGCVQKK